jgi:hypothetical protein
MKKIILSLFVLCGSIFAQNATTTPATPVPVAGVTPAVIASNITLPTYIAGGVAYNQLAGVNLWFSAIVPVVNSSGVYESTTTDLFPTSSVVAGKTVYTFQTSIRQGIHKVVHDDGKNIVLIGGDAGVAFSQSSVTSAGTATGASGSFTVTYVRSITPHFAVMVPVRGLYMPTLGWNPVVEVGLVWKP